MDDTRYVIRQVKPAGRNRVTVTVVDMGGQIREITMNADTYNFEGRDRLIRAVIAHNRHSYPRDRRPSDGSNV